MTNKEVAITILKQLGGNKFIAMTGAKYLSCTDTSMSCKISKNASRANQMTIELNAMDLYDVEFCIAPSYSKKTYEIIPKKVIKSYEGIYAEDLTKIFTEATGMYTSL